MPKVKTKSEMKSPTIPINGLDEFPLEKLGLTVESIERSKGHILIPRELLPYLKICKTPVTTRERKAKRQHRYLLRLRAKELQKLKNKAEGER